MLALGPQRSCFTVLVLYLGLSSNVTCSHLCLSFSDFYRAPRVFLIDPVSSSAPEKAEMEETLAIGQDHRPTLLTLKHLRGQESRLRTSHLRSRMTPVTRKRQVPSPNKSSVMSRWHRIPAASRCLAYCLNVSSLLLEHCMTFGIINVDELEMATSILYQVEC